MEQRQGIKEKDKIARGSLKLRIMSDLTKEVEGKDAATNWKDQLAEEHEIKMINKLKRACGMAEDK